MRTKRLLEAPLDRPVIRRDLIRWIETAHADNVESFKNDLLWRLQKGMFDRTPEIPGPEMDSSVAELIGLKTRVDK